jgi:hypothetical protein
MAAQELVTIEGWLTDDPEEFRMYSRPGVRWSFREQLSIDVRSWKPWAAWLVAVGAFVAAAVGGADRPVAGVPYLMLGVALSSTYVRALFAVVRGRQRQRLLEATVRFDSRHPLSSSLLTGVFTEAGGTAIGRAFLPEWAAEKTRRADGCHYVLVAYDSAAEMNAIIGIRAPE